MSMTTKTAGASAEWASEGDLVTYGRSPKVYRVDKVISRVNFEVTDEDGKKYKLRRASALHAPEGATWAGPAAREVVAPSALGIFLGTVVELKDGRFADGTRYVVIKKNGIDSVSLAELNGDHDRYIRGVSPDRLRVVRAS